MSARRLSAQSSSALHTSGSKLGLVLIGLAIVAISFAALSGPRAAPTDNAAPVEVHATRVASVRAPTQLPQAAERVARNWTEAYASSSYRDSMPDVLRELRPYSSGALLREMSNNSGAPALSNEQHRSKYRTKAEVVAVHPQDDTPDSRPLVLVYEQNTLTSKDGEQELRTITLGLAQTLRGWKVTEVLVP